jgi:hypothetical protein
VMWRDSHSKWCLFRAVEEEDSLESSRWSRLPIRYPVYEQNFLRGGAGCPSQRYFRFGLANSATVAARTFRRGRLWPSEL